MDDRPVVMFFGTYDASTHPRVRVLAEGLAANGCNVVEINQPLGFDTAARVQLAAQPWRAPVLVARVGRAWWRLWRAVRAMSAAARQPDLVVVGYLGHFDVHLAKRLFRAPVALDYLVGLGDTATDRRLDSRKLMGRILHGIDSRAAAAADVVVVDTADQATMVPSTAREVLTLAVGAPAAWFHEPTPTGGPLRVVFFGLYTPLQGAVTVGRAIALLEHRDDIVFSMIGDGQDREATEAAAGSGNVEWTDWVDGNDLPSAIAAHHVCLGVFGTTAKAQRVVPNKVFQGAAAGCAIITSDTPPQRAALDDAATFVPIGDAAALAEAIASLADDADHLGERQAAAAERAGEAFRPATVTGPLLDRVRVST